MAPIECPFHHRTMARLPHIGMGQAATVALGQAFYTPSLEPQSRGARCPGWGAVGIPQKMPFPFEFNPSPRIPTYLEASRNHL